MRDVGFWQGIMEVAHGKGQFRLFLQPAMAIFLGVKLGIGDAKHGKDPFLMRLFVTGQHRWQLAKESVRQALIPFCIAIVLDCILQYLTRGSIRPLAALVVGAVLIWIPFMLSRAITNRIYMRTRHHQEKAA